MKVKRVKTMATPPTLPDSVSGELDFELKEIETGLIDNHVLRDAIARIKERCLPEAHASYYTKHSSHSRYSKGMW